MCYTALTSNYSAYNNIAQDDKDIFYWSIFPRNKPKYCYYYECMITTKSIEKLTSIIKNYEF